MTAVARDEPDDWWAPGIYQVAPGVHRIPLPLPTDGLRAVNAYAVEDTAGLVLIDSGLAIGEARDQLAKALAQLGAGLGDVRSFLVTHVHRDHYTQAVVLRREFGTHVAMGKGEQPSLQIHADPDYLPLGEQLDRLRACGATELVPAVEAAIAADPVDRHLFETPDTWLTAGTDTGLADRMLSVLPTPGHTQGHVVFADADAGLLFTGDHILPHITPSIGLEAVVPELPLRDYLASLRLVRELPDMRLLPAHGPAAPSVHDRIDELIAHHEDRLELTISAVRRGANTSYDVARALPWTRRHRRIEDLDPFNQMLAVLETAAHLDLLVFQGTLALETTDGIEHYREV